MVHSEQCLVHIPTIKKSFLLCLHSPVLLFLGGLSKMKTERYTGQKKIDLIVSDFREAWWTFKVKNFYTSKKPSFTPCIKEQCSNVGWFQAKKIQDSSPLNCEFPSPHIDRLIYPEFLRIYTLSFYPPFPFTSPWILSTSTAGCQRV